MKITLHSAGVGFGCMMSYACTTTLFLTPSITIFTQDMYVFCLTVGGGCLSAFIFTFMQSHSSMGLHEWLWMNGYGKIISEPSLGLISPAVPLLTLSLALSPSCLLILQLFSERPDQLYFQSCIFML